MPVTEAGHDIIKTGDVLTLHPEVCVGKERGRIGNLTLALETHRRENSTFWASLKGKAVLVRPNIANPGFPQGCSSPDSLVCLLEQLIAAGVSKIDVGDLSSSSYYKAHPDIDKPPQLLYQKVVQKIQLKSPRVAISLVELRPEKSGLQPIKLNQTGLPIVDISQYAALINLVLPKEHGQYFFSCGTKHLMGLVIPEARADYFHQHGGIEDLKKASSDQKITSEAAQETQREMGPIPYPHNGNAQEIAADSRNQPWLFLYNAWIQVLLASKFDEANMGKMATFIQEAVNCVTQQGTQILTVVDGYQTLTGHEHRGNLQTTDFALVGLNPLVVDLLVARHLGLYNQVSYLKRLSYLVQPKIIGDKLTDGAPYKLKRKPIDVRPNLKGEGFIFACAVTRE